MQFEDVPIKCSKRYVEFICRRAYKKDFKSEFHIFGWFPGLQNLVVFFEEFIAEQVLKSFSGRNNSLKPPVFGFGDSFPFDLEESRE